MKFALIDRAALLAPFGRTHAQRAVYYLFFWSRIGRKHRNNGFLVSSASVQIMASPLSWLADEDRMDPGNAAGAPQDGARPPEVVFYSENRKPEALQRNLSV